MVFTYPLLMYQASVWVASTLAKQSAVSARDRYGREAGAVVRPY